MSAPSLATLLAEVRSCRVCEEHLPAGPRPVVQAGKGARLVIIGQAPGRRVHESGVPWDDPSGYRLRDWLALPRLTFYDPEQVALVPMGFCYPGTGASGDNPPRPECAPLWHHRLLGSLPADVLRILIGRYAQARYLPGSASTLTDTVRAWRAHLPTWVLPHPSPRNQRWMTANPWFASDLLPELRHRVRDAISA